MIFNRSCRRWMATGESIPPDNNAMALCMERDNNNDFISFWAESVLEREPHNIYILLKYKESMNRELIGVIVFLLALPLLSAQTLYLQDSLLMQVSVESEFELKATGSPAAVEEASADLLFFPFDDFRQKVRSLDTSGTVQDKKIHFEWNDGKIEHKKYGYKAIVETNNQMQEVETKILYPLMDQQIQGFEQYIQPTKTIDSDNPAVIAKATELAEGEDDLFKVTFKLASWVEENVNYDLNTITEKAALPASWVLENKEGVCDEMTSLFVAMARSLGIPARFVTGISYSTSKLFATPWQPHGWAEVYFPDVGWVSFDITFGEYGYVDVTHLKLRDGFDPSEPATQFEWLGKNVELNPEQLQFEVSILKKGVFAPEKIQLEQEILAAEVATGSYNLIKGVLKNTEDHYAATTLTLAVPKEIEVLGRNKRTILLSPKEVRDTYWVIKVPNDLSSKYVYTFPAAIYSEKNITVGDSFQVLAGKTVYTRDEIEKLTISDEEKTYSRKVTFDCQYLKEIRLGEESKVACSVRNRGTTNLVDLVFCLGEVCDTFDLLINQEKKSEILVKGDKAGQKKLVVTAENKEVEKKSVLEYAVVDTPVLEVKMDVPGELSFDEAATITVIAGKKSFSIPQKVQITLESAGLSQQWSVENLPQEISLPIEISDLPLMANNKFTIRAEWEDKEGKSYSLEKEIVIPGKAKTFGERVKMMLNRIVYLFA